MAVRGDLTVDYTVSPRVVTIAAPSTTITIQDLYDTLQTEQSRVYNSAFPALLNGFGKQDLGGGVRVGVTLELRNTRLAFAARAGPSTIQCTVKEGNLVATDDAGAVINAIEPSAFTQVVVQQSTSASIAAGTLSLSKYLALR